MPSTSTLLVFPTPWLSMIGFPSGMVKLCSAKSLETALCGWLSLKRPLPSTTVTIRTSLEVTLCSQLELFLEHPESTSVTLMSQLMTFGLLSQSMMEKTTLFRLALPVAQATRSQTMMASTIAMPTLLWALLLSAMVSDLSG